MKAKLIKIGITIAVLVFLGAGNSWADSRKYHRPHKKHVKKHSYIIKHPKKHHYHPKWGRYPHYRYKRYYLDHRPWHKVPHRYKYRPYRQRHYRHHHHYRYDHDCFRLNSRYGIMGLIVEPGWSFMFATRGKR